MLKSFIYHHNKNFNLLLYENSPDNKTAKLLNENNIPFIRNPGATHSISVDQALYDCKTKYALLVDSDIIFLKQIYSIFDKFKNSKATLMGELCKNRGEYNLKPRINPWFCFINIEDIQKNNIRFHDEKRIKKTKSEGFYKNMPLGNKKDSSEKYDVGSTFFEDVKNEDLKIIDFPKINNFFYSL